jgi:hypothetical protein
MIGTSRSRHTSKSFLVCSSMPLWRHWGGVGHHHGTVDRGQRAADTHKTGFLAAAANPQSQIGVSNWLSLNLQQI